MYGLAGSMGYTWYGLGGSLLYIGLGSCLAKLFGCLTMSIDPSGSYSRERHYHQYVIRTVGALPTCE